MSRVMSTLALSGAYLKVRPALRPCGGLPNHGLRPWKFHCFVPRSGAMNAEDWR